MVDIVKREEKRLDEVAAGLGMTHKQGSGSDGSWLADYVLYIKSCPEHASGCPFHGDSCISIMPVSDG